MRHKRKWHFHEKAGIVSNDKDEWVRLEPRLAALFAALFDNLNDLVLREELINKVWADSIVNEDSLRRAVSDLRKSLDLNFKNPLIIETSPKRGYKMLLPGKSKIRPLWIRAALLSIYFLFGLILLGLVVRGINY